MVKYNGRAEGRINSGQSVFRGIEVPDEWAERLPHEPPRGLIMLVGAPDSGKTTLARYLWERFAPAVETAAWLDADIGQSTLGPPTTMTLAVTRYPASPPYPPKGMRRRYFVGNTSPRGHMLSVVVGVVRLARLALRQRAHFVVVDTTGLIAPERGGVALKQAKLELLRPRWVLALQRGDELEPILAPWDGHPVIRIVRLPVAEAAAPKTRERRRAHRREQFRRYFARAGRLVLALEELSVVGHGAPVPGLLVGLQDHDGFTRALGIVEDVESSSGRLVVRTPLRDSASVRALRLGRVHLTAAFEEYVPRRHPAHREAEAHAGEETRGDRGTMGGTCADDR
ncbi:MAG: Clp1/GlmU family protein [Ardenticatenia bacterium]|nr:Clp1/GlmU family protein [Ardenticatenia bacterium]